MTAGLKCAPEATASVWMSMKSTNTCTSPMTPKSMYGVGLAAVGGVT